MRKVSVKSKTKQLVISGYILLVLIMLLGLWGIYRNLVDFSEKRIKHEDRQELIIVSNIINELYEAESSYDLLTFESAEKYIESFSEKRPSVSLRLDTLKQLTEDSIRTVQLDSIDILLDEKEENLIAVFALMDSLRKSPSIIRESENTLLPNKRSDNIDKYLKDKSIEDENTSTVDTTVIIGKKKGLLRRLGDAFAGKQDSVVIVEKNPNNVVHKDYKLVVDTIVNMIKYSERFDLQNQRRYQMALSDRQALMNATNQTLTSRVDGLLKTIEKEEVEKTLLLVEAKEHTLSQSYKIVSWVSLIAFLIAVVFGLLFITDVNRSQRYKRRLEESNRHINKLLQSREKLMLSISHDIKSPIGSVLGYIELMESNTNIEYHESYLLNMKKSSEHILQLVTNLLDYQRIESNTWTRKEMNFSLSELVGTTADSFDPLSKQKNIAFEVYNNVPNNLMAHGDPFMIREIYSNIISNAIKYTFEGQVVVNIDFNTDEETLHLSVKDSGVGIAEEHHYIVFEEFEQIAPDSLDSYSKGSGLGLAITKGLVEHLNGTISFVSEKGVGTEFFVDLPISISDAEKFEDDVKAIDRSDLKLDGLSVLLVDDDPIQLTMASAMLSAQNVNVVMESDPSKVLSILSKYNFDIIFCDIQMPKVNGFNLVKQIVDSGMIKDKSTPIIALTATSELDIRDYQESGFTSYLNKPYSSRQLFNIILKSVKDNGEKYSDNSSPNPKGVEALISYVRDDEDSMMAILKAFIDESNSLNDFLKNADTQQSDSNPSNLAHKMLPLFKMMGDRHITSNLLELEKNSKLGDKDLKITTERIDLYIQHAEELIESIK